MSLTAWADGVKVYGETPFVTPWRTIQLADRAEDLVPAVLGLNLNPPNALDDVSWIEPMKYVGHLVGHAHQQGDVGLGSDCTAPPPRTRSATSTSRPTTASVGVLVEGWNVGWDGDWIANADLFSFTEAYPDYDLEGLAAYAKERGVGPDRPQRNVDGGRELRAAAGRRVRPPTSGWESGRSRRAMSATRPPRGTRTTGSTWCGTGGRSSRSAARNRVMVNAHEPIKDTGERRTYPHMMTREGTRGQEYNAWARDGGNPPEHETILFFTRMIWQGRWTITPGVLRHPDLESTDGTPRLPEESRVRTTLAKQLALYVVLYSPLQMAADLPENYEGQPAFQFIRDVPVDWERHRHACSTPVSATYVVVAAEGAGRTRTGIVGGDHRRGGAHASRSRCRSCPRTRASCRDLRRR